MSNDPVKDAIEAMADTLYRLEYGAAGGLAAEKEWAIEMDLEWPTATTAIFYTRATAALYAMHGIVRVVPMEATEEMEEATRYAGSITVDVGALDAATAAGDLTKPKG